MTLRDEVAAILALSDGLSAASLAEATGQTVGAVVALLEALGASKAMGLEDGKAVTIYRREDDGVMAAKDKIREFLEAHPAERFDGAQIVAKLGIPDGTARGVLNTGALTGEWVKHEPGDGRRTVTYQAIQTSGFAEGAQPAEPARPKGGLAAVFGKIPDMPLPAGPAHDWSHPHEVRSAVDPKDYAQAFAAAERYLSTPVVLDDGAQPLREFSPDLSREQASIEANLGDKTLERLLEVEREIGRLMERRDALRARLAG